MVDVRGRWALITGASRGIGRLAALFMAERGCNLILQGRTLEHCEKVLQEVRAKGVEAYAVAAELSDLDAVAAMLKEIDEKTPVVDIVLNNAGLQIAYRVDYYETPVSDYILSQTNGVSPNKKADYPFRQSTLLFGLHAVFCLIELSRVTCRTVEIQSVFPASNFIISRRLCPSLRMDHFEF